MPSDVKAAERPPTTPAPDSEPTPRAERIAARRWRHTFSRRPGLVEALVVILVATIAYSVIGYYMLVDGHVVIFDAVDRLSRAYMVWYNDPAKLAAIGFAFPPVPTLAFLPLAIIKPLATSLVALPIASALPAAGTLAMLNVTCARCDMSRAARYAALLLFGLNPMFVFYAVNGQGTALGLFLLSGALLAVVSWYIIGSTRYLVGAGFAMAIAMLTDYQYIVWAIVLAVVVALRLDREEVANRKFESTEILYLAPVVYAAVLWTLLNGVILESPFGWLVDGSSYASINSDTLTQEASVTFDAAVERSLEVLVGIAPLALLVFPALLVSFFSRRDRLSLCLAGLVLLAPSVIVIQALITQEAGELVLNQGLVIGTVAFVGAAWIYYSMEDWRALVAPALLVVLALSLPFAWDAMKSYPYQNQAQAFTRFISTGESQEGTNSIGGYTVGIDPELAMADAIKRIVGESKNAILTDNAQTYAVILLTGRPQIFFDRIDFGDDVWKSTRDSPYGEVSYMLIATETPADLIRQRYPRVAEGKEPSFTPVFRTSRYLLVRVADRRVLPTPGTTGVGTPDTLRTEPRRVTPRQIPVVPDMPTDGTDLPSSSEPGVEGQ